MMSGMISPLRVASHIRIARKDISSAGINTFPVNISAQVEALTSDELE